MSKKIRDNAPKTWNRFLKFRDKAAVAEFCDSEKLYGFTAFYASKPFVFMVCTLGRNPTDPGDIITFDLSNDPDDLIDLDETELAKFVRASPNPIRRFRANGVPMLSGAAETHHLSKVGDTEFAELERRSDQLQSNPALRSRLIDAHIESRLEYPESSYVEKNLYQGFPSSADTKLMERFHETGWSDRFQLVRQFDDIRFRELAERLIYIEAPEVLPPDRFEYWQQYLKKRLLGMTEDFDASTLPSAIEEADEFILNNSGEKRAFFEQHKAKLVEASDRLKSH